MISKKNPHWVEAHTKLQEVMKKEIDIMREILANMHQEEYFLLSNDKISRAHVLEERALLLTRFHEIRNTRFYTTETLEDLSCSFSEQSSLEDCFAQDKEKSCETLFLRDQLIAISDRMTKQNARNQVLFKLTEDKTSQNSYQELAQTSKRKNRIATIPRDFINRSLG